MHYMQSSLVAQSKEIDDGSDQASLTCEFEEKLNKVMEHNSTH